MKYFQHDTNSRGHRKLRKVLRTHGTTGYAIWWAILEELYSADEDGFEIHADELWLEQLAESLCISDYRTLIRVLDTFAELGLIDGQMWQEHYIHSNSIRERGDAYIEKKTKNAQRQARFREKQKQKSEPKPKPKKKEQVLHVSNALCNADSNDVTPSEIRDQRSEIRDQNSEDIDQLTSLSLNPDPEGGERENANAEEKGSVIPDDLLPLFRKWLIARAVSEGKKSPEGWAIKVIENTQNRSSEKLWSEYLLKNEVSGQQQHVSGLDKSSALAKIAAEQRRLGLPGVLQGDWAQRFGVQLVSELSRDQAIEYLAHLEALEVAA